MAQYSLNAYDADVYIPEFRGLMQYGDHMGDDLRYSPDAKNVETPGGVLQPAMGLSGPKLPLVGTLVHEIYPAVTDGTLMYLRNYATTSIPAMSGYAGYTGGPVSPSGRDGIQGGFDTYYIAAHGRIYALTIFGDPKESLNYTSVPCTFGSSSDMPAEDGFFTSDRWSWCTYEYNHDNNDDDSLIDSQVIIMTNAKDGVYMIHGRTNKIYKIDTPANFAWVEQYADRIWGCGIGPAGHDVLYYSYPYSVDKWDEDSNDPAKGGGDIREPTWDKDRFVALKTFGDALIAFTKKRAWKITGSDPTNFMVQEQYGSGCLYPDTIAVMDNYILMLGEDSLVAYDGYKCTPFMKEATYELFRKIGWNEFVRPVGVRYGTRYLLAMANEVGSHLTETAGQYFEILNGKIIIDPQSTTKNVSSSQGYMVLVYNTQDGTINQVDTPQIISFCELMPYALTYVPANGAVDASNQFCQIRFDSWENQEVSGAAVKWTSPWITFGRQDIKKGGFELYFTPELRKKKVRGAQWWPASNVNGEDTSSQFDYTETAGSVTLKFSIQTEKKTKSKNYVVQPLTDDEIAAGKKHKMKRLHFGGAGRRFRLIIECAAGNTIPWRLIGGIHIIAETDKD